MTPTTTDLTGAVAAVERALLPAAEDTTNGWRWRVRREMAGLRDALVAESGSGAETWMAAREVTVLRERTVLLTRVGVLGSQVLERTDVDRLRGDLRRLLDDVRRHDQRRHDLAYDEVELELGGSE